MRNTSPAFQFYVDDFQTDEKIGLMRLAEIGLLTLLLCRCWHDQSIPDDVDKIAALTRAEAKKYWPAVRACFEGSSEPGRLRHADLDHQREQQATFREKQRQSGAVGGARRWHSDPIVDPIGNPNRVAIATPIGSDSSHTHTHTHTVVDDDISNIIKALRNLDVDEAIATELAQQASEECRLQLRVIDLRRGIKDKAAYIVSAIRGKYPAPEQGVRARRRAEAPPDPVPKDRKPTKVGTDALLHIGQLIGVPVDENRSPL